MTEQQRHTLRLEGCTSTPLANYLKALGVFRIIAEQADPEATAWWQGDVFHLESIKSHEELLFFFANNYSPSPLVAPWGARSGFYSGSSEKSAREALERIANSEDCRLDKFRYYIKQIRKIMELYGFTEKPESDNKTEFCRLIRNEVPDDLVAWIDTCYILAGDKREYPPIMGCGGNEGSGSFVSGFAQQIVNVFLEKRYPNALTQALFGKTSLQAMSGQSPGHFSPEASYTNLLNPWDYLLLMEGTLLWASAASKSYALGRNASFPFTYRPSGVGDGSLTLSDEKRPNEAKRDVYEVWMPLWTSGVKMAELKGLLSEGRVTTCRRTAETATDAVQGMLSLGTDKGISAFKRFVFLMRNGQNFMGMDLGRIKTSDSIHPYVALINDENLDRWHRRIRSVCAKATTPASIVSAYGGFERTVFKMIFKERMTDVLISLGCLERTIAGSPKTAGDDERPLSPLPLLRRDWINAADDGSVEYRLACSLASIRGFGEVGALRSNMIPCNVQRPWSAYDSGQMDKPHVVWQHGNLVDNLIDVLRRRCMDAQRHGLQTLPLCGTFPVPISDIVAFIRGDVNEARIEEFLWGLNAVDWRHDDAPRMHLHDSGESTAIPPCYALLKLTHAPLRPDGIPPGPGTPGIPFDPAILARAGAGQINATRIAAQRLKASGWKPLVNVVAGAPHHIRRCAAAVLFPTSRSDLRRTANTVMRIGKDVNTINSTEELARTS